MRVSSAFPGPAPLVKCWSRVFAATSGDHCLAIYTYISVSLNVTMPLFRLYLSISVSLQLVRSSSKFLPTFDFHVPLCMYKILLTLSIPNSQTRWPSRRCIYRHLDHRPVSRLPIRIASRTWPTGRLSPRSIAPLSATRRVALSRTRMRRAVRRRVVARQQCRHRWEELMSLI